MPWWTICLLLFAFQLEHKLACKRPLLSFSMMDAGIFNTAKISVNQKTDAPQTNAVSRQVNITHNSVYCCFIFHGNEWWSIKEIKESDISSVSLSDKVCFLKSTDSSLLKLRINSTALFWIVNLPRLITMLLGCKEDVLHLKGFQNKPWQPALHIKWRDSFICTIQMLLISLLLWSPNKLNYYFI